MREVIDRCALCGEGIDKNDPDNWKQVTGWVGGPRKDSMRLRMDTGRLAHADCVAKMQEGADPKTQPSMFEETTVTPSQPDAEDAEAERSLFGDGD